MGVRLQRLVVLAGWLALVPVSARAETALSLVEAVQPSGQAVDLAQAATQITGVRVEGEGEGLRLVLDANGALAEPTTSVVGNALVAEIANAVLALPEGESFEQFGPAEGIALVSVTSEPGNRVRVAITGSDGPPAVAVNAGAGGLVLGIAPGVALASGENDVIRLGVTGAGDEGYNPTRTSTATRTDTPLRYVPQSVQVIPRAVIEDRGVTELDRALETAGSVVSAGGRGTSVFGPGFLIRGFPIRGAIFRDGISTFSLAPLSTNDVEQVEILRGPASVLFGQGEPGGILNLVSKQPLGEPFYSVGATVGSFSTFGGNTDLTGPLTEDGSVRYRLNLSYENVGSFRDFVDGERLLVSPTLTWDIGPDTSINFFSQYARDRETIDEGIPFTADGPVDVPRSRFVGEDFGEFSQDQFTLGYRLNHDLNEDWSLRHATQYLQYSPRRFWPAYDFFDETTGDIDRTEYFAGGNYRRLFTNAEAVGRFSTGSVNHQVLVGVEYRNVLEQPEFQFSNFYTPINVFNPVYTGIPYAIEPEFFRDDTISTWGFYAQDQIEVLPNLKFLAGIRYDVASQFRTTQDLGDPREDFTQTDSAFSPRLGVVYQPIEPVSLYASYTRSFSPSFGASLNADGSNFDPETGQQFEVGAKVDISDRLSLNLALFDLRRQNVRTPDLTNPRLSVQTGEVTSRGIELNLGGEILPGWNITSSYTFLDATVTRDNRPAVQGNRVANAPDNQFSLWSTYEIQEGDLQGLGFGLGLFYLSDRAGDLRNTFTLPSYFRTDAALFYRRDNWRAQLNVENLFNINYFTASDEFQFANPGAPFTVTARVAVEF
ncbi:TonB-dependent siderophore receptor [Nodosilinea sp. PGN35]|uniref:TonB-dependent siderophore receptor n=1 Tax=Nodosilinea sp. PGN35 TaxID=3020489 RepID=UPI0023B2A630|nr:TonB-dependent siderophore receptor [Nodosilinea sp. TSF1-S3]MDF0366438.1 TonB-dependent siderophore receptor [Nodosilinea sp. TSF1-S3]